MQYDCDAILAKYLIDEMGVDPNCTTSELRETLLLRGALRSDYQLVDALLCRNAMVSAEDANGRTPLMAAIAELGDRRSQEAAKTVMSLLRNGADAELGNTIPDSVPLGGWANEQREMITAVYLAADKAGCQEIQLYLESHLFTLP
eukprot:NODE_1648_length_563_cov_693.770428_g1331_i0.p1 GENE.NODE_1648_length_563_cov_693.770428_g1331_i0~~NODE_1648_length_563_cov_693.770428_g1331_i0.p1  ORF type:complete len:146 (+),score=19.41 NODE_1648_length_563_cov_693.770428_g1331_i0:48-485(+)